MPSGDGFDSAAEVLQAVASPLRLAILVQLQLAPCTVGDLADMLAVSQPLVSHHLKILRQAGLVTVRRHGQRAIYTTTAHPVVGLAVAAATHHQAIHHRRTIMTSTEHLTHADHDHTHGEGCGHVAVPHGDHIDYVHDTHLHFAHDGHWDECEPTEHITHPDHDHTHAQGCGHVAVPHGDHIDYIHDGHRHAAHDEHWDEH